MYSHDPVQQHQRAQSLAEFAEQTRLHLSGELNEPEFRVVRLRQGLCIRRHGPMLRIALPFGLLGAAQLRKLAIVARRWDRGYVHLSSRRQHVEFHWLRLADAPALLAELALAQLYAVPAGGSSGLHIICPPLAGISPGELIDPLPWCELLRQWAQIQPKLDMLPCGFTVAISGRPGDLDSIGAHDLGIQAIQLDGRPGFSISVLGQPIQAYVPEAELLNHLHAILHARTRHVQFMPLPHEQSACLICNSLLVRCAARFSMPRFPKVAASEAELNARHADFAPRFARWLSTHVATQRPSGYAAVRLQQDHGKVPGQFGADQLEALAEMAERYGLGRMRLLREQTLMLIDVRRNALYPLWRELDLLGLAAPIHSPQLVVAQMGNSLALGALHQRVAELDYLFDVGELDLHVPLQLLGANIPADQWPDAVERLLRGYLVLRDCESERFVDVLERLGSETLLRQVAISTPSTLRRLP